MDVVVFPRITVSPTIRYDDDYYGINPTYQEGIDDRKSLSWGADVAYAASGDFNLVFSYYKEYGYMSMYGVNIPHGAACGNVGCGPGSAGTTTYGASDNATVDTISAGAEWAAIPDKLQLNVRLALSKGSDQETAVATKRCGADRRTISCRYDVVHASGRDGDLQIRSNVGQVAGLEGRRQGQAALYLGKQLGQQLAKRLGAAVRHHPRRKPICSWRPTIRTTTCKCSPRRSSPVGSRKTQRAVRKRALVFAGESHALLSAGFSSVAVDGKSDAAQGRGGTRSRRNSLHSTLYDVWRVALFELAALCRTSLFWRRELSFLRFISYLESFVMLAPCRDHRSAGRRGLLWESS